jgi:hypothetical protein
VAEMRLFASLRYCRTVACLRRAFCKKEPVTS